MHKRNTHTYTISYIVCSIRTHISDKSTHRTYVHTQHTLTHARTQCHTRSMHARRHMYIFHVYYAITATDVIPVSRVQHWQATAHSAQP